MKTLRKRCLNMFLKMKKSLKRPLVYARIFLTLVYKVFTSHLDLSIKTSSLCVRQWTKLTELFTQAIGIKPQSFYIDQYVGDVIDLYLVQNKTICIRCEFRMFHFEVFQKAPDFLWLYLTKTSIITLTGNLKTLCHVGWISLLLLKHTERTVFARSLMNIDKKLCV